MSDLAMQFSSFQSLVPPQEIITEIYKYTGGLFELFFNAPMLAVLFFVSVVVVNHFFTSNVFAMVPGHFQFIITLIFMVAVFAFVLPQVVTMLGW